MKTYVVSYDLHRAGQNYAGLVKALESYATHYHLQGSVWLIQTPQTAVQVRDHLRLHIDANDTLLVAALTGVAAWAGPLDSQWLKAVLETTTV